MTETELHTIEKPKFEAVTSLIIEALIVTVVALLAVFTSHFHPISLHMSLLLGAIFLAVWAFINAVRFAPDSGPPKDFVFWAVLAFANALGALSLALMLVLPTTH
jgi:hypothetical protein